RLVTSSLGIDAVLDAVGREAADLVSAAEVGFWIADEATRTLTLRQVGPRPVHAYPATVMSYGESVAGWVAEHREAAWIADAPKDARIARRDWWEGGGYKGLTPLPWVPGASLSRGLPLVAQPRFRVGLGRWVELLAVQGPVPITN